MATHSSTLLGNPMDGGVWQAAVHGVVKSQKRLSNFTVTFHFHALEKEMATHPSVLAWRIPGMGKPGGLPSMGLHRVRYDLAAAAAVSEKVKILNQQHEFCCSPSYCEMSISNANMKAFNFYLES